MARNSCRLKMGFFPLPEEEAHRIKSLLSFSGPCSVVDPCAGKGTALNLITAGAPVARFGVELDTDRAEEAAKVGIRMIKGNTFDAQAKVESFSLLYLNPPYDSEIDLAGNRRMERLFLDHTHRWLIQRGMVLTSRIAFSREATIKLTTSENAASFFFAGGAECRAECLAKVISRRHLMILEPHKDQLVSHAGKLW